MTKRNTLRADVDWASVQIDGINHSDYPDYVDAYASYAEYVDGVELTDEELDYLNDAYREEVYELVQDAATDSWAMACDDAMDRVKDGD